MTGALELTQKLQGRWHRNYGTAPCPVCQPEARRDQNALTVSDGRDGRLLAHCKRLGCDFRSILAAAGIAPGGYRPPTPAEIARREAEQQAAAAKRAGQAERLWHEARPIKGTLAETYLRAARGISCPLPPTLRFHPDCWHAATSKRFPAMVALVEGAAGFSVHRTYLRPDGLGKADIKPAKTMLGAVAGGAVRLSIGAERLLVGEGIESTISAFTMLGSPRICAWAALSTSGMRSLRLPRVGGLGGLGTIGASLVIAVDGDKAGRDAGRQLGERANALGWEVGFLDPGGFADWNDRLMLDGGSHECA